MCGEVGRRGGGGGVREKKGRFEHLKNKHSQKDVHLARLLIFHISKPP